MEIKVYNKTGEIVGNVELADSIFGLKINQDLLHQVLETQSANSREVIAHTKDRAQVRGGGKKPWRQKGTGRARHGSIRSPIWKGGGVTFGPTKERNFSKSINTKMRRKALFMALSSKLHDNQMAVIDAIKTDNLKTKEATVFLGVLPKIFNGYKSTKNKKDSVLAITETKDRNTEKSFSNLSFASVAEVRNINPVDVLKYKYIVFSQNAVGKVGEIFKLK